MVVEKSAGIVGDLLIIKKKEIQSKSGESTAQLSRRNVRSVLAWDTTQGFANPSPKMTKLMQRMSRMFLGQQRRLMNNCSGLA